MNGTSPSGGNSLSSIATVAVVILILTAAGTAAFLVPTMMTATGEMKSYSETQSVTDATTNETVTLSHPDDDLSIEAYQYTDAWYPISDTYVSYENGDVTIDSDAFTAEETEYTNAATTSEHDLQFTAYDGQHIYATTPNGMSAFQFNETAETWTNLSYVDAGNHTQNIYFQNGRIYLLITNETADIHYLNTYSFDGSSFTLLDENNISLGGSSVPYGLTGNGTVIYVTQGDAATSGTIESFQWNGSATNLKHTFQATDYYWGEYQPYAREDLVYVPAKQNGMRILRYNVSATPDNGFTWVANHSNGDIITWIWANETRIVTTGEDSPDSNVGNLTVWSFDGSTITEMWHEYLGSVNADGYADYAWGAVTVRDSTIYAGASSAIGPPDNPQFRAYDFSGTLQHIYNMSDGLSDVIATEDYIYIADAGDLNFGSGELKALKTELATSQVRVDYEDSSREAMQDIQDSTMNAIPFIVITTILLAAAAIIIVLSGVLGGSFGGLGGLGDIGGKSGGLPPL